MHRPMSSGQHILIFLYPLSRLGFTSPVGGSLGQVVLDPSGKNVSRSGSVVQLERAIRSARGEEEGSCIREFWRLPLFLSALPLPAAPEARLSPRAAATAPESKVIHCSGRMAPCSTSPIRKT